MAPQHYIWFVLYDLSLMTIGCKVPCRTFNDRLSFATHLLQLRAFNHIVYGMTTKSMIYKVLYLRISFNAYGLYYLIATKRFVKLLSTSRIVQHVFFLPFFLLFLLLSSHVHLLIIIKPQFHVKTHWTIFNTKSSLTSFFMKPSFSSSSYAYYPCCFLNLL